MSELFPCAPLVERAECGGRLARCRAVIDLDLQPRVSALRGGHLSDGAFSRLV